MYIIDMPLSSKYQIVIKDNLLSEIDSFVKEVYNNKNVYIITDERVGSFYLEKVTEALSSFNVQKIVIKGYEEAKSLETYGHICNELINLGATRGEMLIALGGGVIGDLVGFVASTLYRGMDFIQIPTSLLAQVDSSIGGKTGIDFNGHKNIIGNFKQPKLVLIDPTVLKTLPLKELKNGFGEVVKHALIASKDLYELLLINKLDVTEEVIYHNLMIKRSFVLNDEFDKGERMKLNFGHTFGHIIELLYHKLHGEAVIDGMLCAVNFAIDCGVLDKEVKDRLLHLYKELELEYTEYDYKTFYSDIKFDKKNIAKTISLILINEIGNAILYPVREDELL